MRAQTRPRTGSAMVSYRGTAMGPNGATPVVGHGSWTAVRLTTCHLMLVIFCFWLCLSLNVCGWLMIPLSELSGRGM